MDNSLISRDIIEKRKQQAPSLRSLQSETEKIISELEKIERSGAFDSIPPKVSEYKKKLEDVRERVGHRLSLFENGRITIAIAGTEKAGKTTFLNELTGISLPAANARCTAVTCEIVWVPDDKDEGITVTYYNEEELLEIINYEAKYLNDHKAQVWKKPEEQVDLPMSTSLAFFRSVRLPSADDITPTGTLAYGPSLLHLHAIQQALAKDGSVLGQTKPDNLSELERYVKHRSGANEQTLIRQVLIKKHYEGGRTGQCLCDTPGVDDPNPEAFRRTIKTLKEETDMLVILDRPKDSPSITGSLAQFIANLESVGSKDYPMRERAIFLVNWYKDADPNGDCARARLEEVRAKNVIPNLPKPCDVTDKGAREEFIAYLNERLRDTLPDQDEKAVHSLQDEVSELKTGVLTNVVQALESQKPPLPEKQRAKVDIDFNKWFDPEDESKGFMFRLRSQFEKLTEKPWEDNWSDGLVEEVKKISLESREKIIKAISEDVTEEKIREIKGGTERDVTGEVFSEFQGLFSKYVEKLTTVVAKIGPHILKRVNDVISRALGEKIATRLRNEDEETLVDALRKELAAEPTIDADVSIIAESLDKLVKVQEELGHISRYELRPALNLIDPLRWGDQRLKRLKEKALDVIEHSEDSKTKRKLVSFLRDPKTKLPSKSDPPATFVGFIRGVFAAFLYCIEEIQRSNKEKFEALMEDYASDASLSLCTRRGAKSGWRSILRNHADIIVPGYDDLAKNSERAALCNSMIKELREAIGN